MSTRIASILVLAALVPLLAKDPLAAASGVGGDVVEFARGSSR
jgi:hypothetical protein